MSQPRFSTARCKVILMAVRAHKLRNLNPKFETQIWWDREDLELVTRVAEMLGLKRASFVRQAAIEKAEEELEGEKNGRPE